MANAYYATPHIPTIKHRTLYYLYVENAKITQKDFALSITREEGTTNLPISQITCLMIGPGSSITSQAIKICAEMGVTVQWVGEGFVRMYASGNPIAKSSQFLLRQVELVSNQKSRLKVAKDMYQKRFPGEDVSALSMEQLRGREGTRVKKIYKENAEKYGVSWEKRTSRMKDIKDEDVINRTMTMLTAALYGVCHSAITALGLSPALGFVHTGNSLSFVYDIADLYKTNFMTPLAFEIASLEIDNNAIDPIVRMKARNLFYEQHLLIKIIKDIKSLLTIETDETKLEEDIIYLWGDEKGVVHESKNWSDDGWK